MLKRRKKQCNYCNFSFSDRDKKGIIKHKVSLVYPVGFVSKKFAWLGTQEGWCNVKNLRMLVLEKSGLVWI